MREQGGELSFARNLYFERPEQTAGHERAAIVDADLDRSSVVEIRDRDAGAER